MALRLVGKAIHRIFRAVGYRLVRNRGLGLDPVHDMQQFLHDVESPVILDVGANAGQSAEKFCGAFPWAQVHSFEPSPGTFELLKQNCAKLPNATAWNYGVGSQSGVLPFLENSHPYMSSFLPPGETAWGEVVRTIEVPVVTVADFAAEQKLDYIHLLKSDTQGFDFQVLQGAEKLMQQNRIGLVYFEVIFSQQYQGIKPFDETFRFLLDHNFQLVTFYRPQFQNDLVSWTDMLFINRDLYGKRPAGIAKRYL